MEEGLRKRLQLMVSAPNWSNALDVDAIEINYTHSIPVDEAAQAALVRSLDGLVADEDLLKLLPFIENPEEALKRLRAQQKEDAKLRQESFATYPDGNVSKPNANAQ